MLKYVNSQFSRKLCLSNHYATPFIVGEFPVFFAFIYLFIYSIWGGGKEYDFFFFLNSYYLAQFHIFEFQISRQSICKALYL